MSSPARRFRPDGAQHVTMRSPIPARPGERVRTCAGRLGEASHLRKAARDERRLRVVAEPEAVGSARRERDDVLGGRAELDSGDVVAHVHAEEHGVHRDLEPHRELEVVARDDRGRWQAADDLLGDVRPGEHRDGRVRTSVERRSPVAGSRPFVRLRSGASPGKRRRRPRRRRGSGLRRRRARRRRPAPRRSARRRLRRGPPSCA